jgi:hypothetical protein
MVSEQHVEQTRSQKPTSRHFRADAASYSRRKMDGWSIVSNRAEHTQIPPACPAGTE